MPYFGSAANTECTCSTVYMGEFQDALIYTLGQNQSSGIRIFTDNLNHAAYRMKFFDVAESIRSMAPMVLGFTP